MPRYRYEKPLRIYEQPHKDAKTKEEVEENRHPPLLDDKQVVQADTVDALLRKARAMIVATGRSVRALSIGPGFITAVAYRPEDSIEDPMVIKESTLRRR